MKPELQVTRRSLDLMTWSYDPATAKKRNLNFN